MKSQTRQSKTKRTKRASSGVIASAAEAATPSGTVDGAVVTARRVSGEGGETRTASTGHAGMCCASDMHHAKLYRVAADIAREDYFSKLSLEIICHILSYLPLKDVVRLESLSRKMHEAITMHLRLLHDIDFTEGEIYGWMCSGFTDTTFAKFLKRCPDVFNIYGLHMRSIAKRRQRVSEQLSIPGIIAALPSCPSLYGVETSDIFLLEAITNYLPHIHILRTFRNRNGCFPLCQSNRFELHRNPRITTLYLTGVVIPELPRMDFLQHLYLKWVKLTDPHPFRDFGVPLLRTFVMNNCAGPTNALKYVPLITGLAGARSLSRLELVRVPFLGGLIQHVVEDSWRLHGFRQLSKVVFGTCKHALEVDLGYLVITCAQKLEELAVQPSLTKDSLFASLTLADVDFPHFETLHLGYVNEFPEHGKWTNDQLVKQGLADINESPAMITDIGMRAVGQVFSNVKAMTVYNCPHLHIPMSWFTPVGQSWQRLKELHLRRCHALRLSDFCRMIPLLPSLESLYLEQMFREPPKGCSRVGLSAGTGLGVSSALVQNSGNDAANQDPVNNNPPAPVPAHPIPAHPAPPGGAPPPPPPMPPDPDMDIVDEDMDSDSDYDPMVEPPFDQLPDPSAEGRHPIVDHVMHQDLSNPRPEVHVDDITEPRSNRGSKGSQDGAKSGAEPQPGTSRESVDRSESKCQCSVSKEKTDKLSVGSGGGASSSINPNCATPDREDCPTMPGRGRLKHTPPHSSEDASPTRRSKRLRLSKGTPPARTASDPEASSSSGNNSSISGGKYTGKGKSLRGRKKGLVKKSRASTNSLDESEEKPEIKKEKKEQEKEEEEEVKNRNQSCQAVSEEIRETTKKAKEKDEAARKGTLRGASANRPEEEDAAVQVSVGSSTCPIHSAAGANPGPAMPGLSTAPQPTISPAPSPGPLPLPPGDMDSDSAVPSPSVPEAEDGRSRRTMGTQTGNRGAPRPLPPGNGSADRRGGVRKPHMCDQATSTSDPVIEEDHVQMLEIHSSSLVSLTLRQVGVTDLVISECPKLQMLAGTACRVLKTVSVKAAPQLTRVHFAQCRKLRHETVVDQVCRQTPERNRLIFLRPMQMYDPVSMERQVMSSGDYNYNMCLVQDYCANPELTLYNRIRATSWADVMFNVNFELLKSRGFQKADRKSLASPTYPWGRDIYKMQGESEGGYWWDLTTDLPWLRTLSESDHHEHPRSLSKQDLKRGLYNPRAKSHGQTDLCLNALQSDIAEANESGLKLFTHCAIVYVNMCDLYGPPVSDKYI